MQRDRVGRLTRNQRGPRPGPCCGSAIQPPPLGPDDRVPGSKSEKRRRGTYNPLFQRALSTHQPHLFCSHLFVQNVPHGRAWEPGKGHLHSSSRPCVRVKMQNEIITKEEEKEDGGGGSLPGLTK